MTAPALARILTLPGLAGGLRFLAGRSPTVPHPRLRLPFVALSFLALLAVVPGVTAQGASGVHRSEAHAFRLDTVVTGLEHPWSVAFLPAGDPSGAMLVTERPGRLRVIRAVAGDGAGWRLEPAPVSGVPEVWARGQGGLMDVVLHPEFARNRLVYLSYSKPGGLGRATTAVVRGRLEGGALVDVEEVLEADAWRRSRVHFGSRMAFGPDGMLYVTVGERGEKAAAQDPSNHQGVTLRLHDDGRVPDDNPFHGEAGARAAREAGATRARPEVWTYGNRSPQGLAFDRETGELWQAEHGPRGGDELNLLLPGRNYGWPAVTFGIDYDGSVISEDTARAEMEPPVHYWVPSIATSGLAIYRGDAFPGWRGDAFVGGLRGTRLARVDLEREAGAARPRAVGWETLLDGYGRVRDVREGPDGFLYLLLDQSDAPLVRLTPAER